MTNLSPAAQAVLRAAQDAQDEWDMSEAAAAALRAAADQLTSAKAIDTLLSIAAELEGATG